ncbi:trefoil factor 1 [Octodon degus]|uniref:Trefoil factor 1 n=1 Tax=Octodon degus TaxID=10160 RepID=A0A6P6EH41_OCTDE|nr:trefoil factor 1 [Octodon degus]
MEHKVTFILAMVLMLVLSALVEGQTETCDVQAKARKNCGFSGITRKECEDRGCCFNNKVRGVPWCFHKQVVEAAEEEEEDCPF